MHNVKASGNKFYKDRRGPSLQAMLLLPLQVLAMGVAPSSLCHYYQMSKVHANEACNCFDAIIFQIYHSQFLSQPTAPDLKNIVTLHKRKHKVAGMMGLLDCTHLVWKNCPKAWEGSFKGKEKKTTIVLEAACDYNHYFWHTSFGFPGSLIDVNILRFSLPFKSFYDDSLKNLETDAGVVPFPWFPNQTLGFLGVQSSSGKIERASSFAQRVSPCEQRSLLGTRLISIGWSDR